MRLQPLNFDRAYYERYYLDPRTAVTSRAEATARARFVAAYVEYVGCPVRTVLDAGCGVGMLRAPLLRALPRATYTGLEYSAYLCERFGWTQGSIDRFRPRTRYDLVICYDVLQYLGERAATRAIGNLAHATRGILYFSALTAEDWRNNCDRSRTDPNVHLRGGDWYRKRLRRGFHEVGTGLWVRRGAPLVLWEMERASRKS
jgi:SAM-dependent methyltransferase